MSENRALLVEDETLVAMIAEDILMAAGYEPVVVDRGVDALKALEAHDFRLAVVDVGLPDMRGDDLAKRIRQEYPALLVVVASGYDESELKARFHGDPQVAFLAKPYTERDLRAAVASLGPAG